MCGNAFCCDITKSRTQKRDTSDLDSRKNHRSAAEMNWRLTTGWWCVWSLYLGCVCDLCCTWGVCVCDLRFSSFFKQILKILTMITRGYSHSSPQRLTRVLVLLLHSTPFLVEISFFFCPHFGVWAQNMEVARWCFYLPILGAVPYLVGQCPCLG